MTIPNNSNTYLPGTVVIPNSIVITAITNSYPMVLTLASTNQYAVGQLVTLTVPNSYGMFQANELTGKILSVSGSGINISLDLDSTLFDVFAVPPTGAEQPASIAPGGARNIYNNTTVPFHNLNNIGN